MDEEEELTGPQVDEALKWYNEALSTVSKMFGPDHPEVGGGGGGWGGGGGSVMEEEEEDGGAREIREGELKGRGGGEDVHFEGHF